MEVKLHVRGTRPFKSMSLKILIFGRVNRAFDTSGFA